MLDAPITAFKVDRDDQRSVLASFLDTPASENDAMFSVTSADGAGYDDIVALAQQLFELLGSSSGHMELDVPHAETVALWSQTPSRTLVVQHQVSGKSMGGDEIWSIDGERCRFSPPRLLFERMPTKVAAVHTHMVSNRSSLHAI